jgi:uncharacterized protein YcbK (DUF882 family)
MVSENFNRKEFACKCGCGFSAVDAELLNILEKTRKWFNKPITINSGNRCFQHNKKEGGSIRSQHLFGLACDFKVEGVHADTVADYLLETYPNKYGIGRYTGRTHVDVRDGIARWDSRIEVV